MSSKRETLNTLNTLIELAADEVEAAAIELGKVIQIASEAEEKLGLLLQYREDYIARFQSEKMSGLTAEVYRNYQGFIDKLDDAIKGQEQIVQEAKRRVEEKKGVWQACERKRASFDTLAERNKQAIRKQEDRREQKQMDEFANRQSITRK